MSNLKRGTICETRGFPAIGGMPAVAPEQVRIVRYAPNVTTVPGDRWYHVRFANDGARLVMHEDALRIISNH